MEWMNTRAGHSKAARLSGISIVEVLIALVLISFVALSISNFLVKSNVTSISLNNRFMESYELYAWIENMRMDLNKGAYISDNSFNERLEYTTYDASENAIKKIYSLCFYSSVPASSDTTCPASTGSNTLAYLKLSTDGGTSWDSPYRMSPFTTYRLQGTPLFLYAQSNNNCTNFTDTNNNGVWLSGEGAATTSCGMAFSSTPVLNQPSQAVKVVLKNFQFTTGKGTPEGTRQLPTDIFIAAPQGPVRGNMAVASPGVKDNPLVQGFSTINASNPQFPVGFRVQGITWDPVHERLLLGNASTSTVATM